MAKDNIIEPIDAGFEDVSKSMVFTEKPKPRLNAEYTGELIIGDINIPCHVLEDSTRVISGRGMQNSLGFSKNSSGLALTKFVSSKLLEYLPEETREKLDKPFVFNRVGSGGSAPETHGFDATILVDICDAIIQANRKGKLNTETQQRYAESAEIIIRSVAKVGIIALVDEATGFQYVRDKQALHQILDKFLNDEKRKWSKTFPDAFWHKLIKIKGYPSYMALKRPSFVGHWVNDIIYDRLAPGIRKKLNEINPRTPKGNRKGTHTQHLTDDYGIPELQTHIEKAMVLMDASSSSSEFKRLLDKSLPKYGSTIQLDLGDK